MILNRRPRFHKRGYKRPKVKRVECLVYSRITGYIRPTVSWADHKRQEFKDRQVYKVEKLEG